MIDPPERIYVDTTIFILAFEGASETSDELKTFFKVAREKPKRLVTSELTLAELHGREAPGKGWVWQKRFYLDLIVFSHFIDLVPISRDILLKTGDYRRAALEGKRKVKLPDAIHCVTAATTQCQYLFTTDKRFPVPSPIKEIGFEGGAIELLKSVLRV